jgi:hypothetical protein
VISKPLETGLDPRFDAPQYITDPNNPLGKIKNPDYSPLGRPVQELEVYLFMFDRLRSIRKDFAIQHTRSRLCTDIYERQVRYMILMEHVQMETELQQKLQGKQYPQYWSEHQQQNFEQLGKTMTSLMSFNAELSGTPSEASPHESEMLAYYILCYAGGEGGSRGVQQAGKGKAVMKKLSRYSRRPDILNAPVVQFAVRVFEAIQTNLFAVFFKLMRDPICFEYPLLCCIMQRYMSEMRMNGLHAMFKAHSHAVPLENIRHSFGM